MTSRQEEYLMLFAVRNGQERSISEVAELFRVSKPTVCSVSSLLEAQGMIHKGTYGEITLTARGWKYIAPKFCYLPSLTTWLKRDLELPEALAEQEARRMAVLLQPQTLRAFARRLCMGKDHGKTDSFYSNLENTLE